MKHLRWHVVWRRSPFTIFFLLLTWFLIYAMTGRGSSVTAQSEPSEWDTPVNLSQSGAASEVVLAQDSTGVVHVLWKDEVAGFVYTRSGPERWLEPEMPELPFMTELTAEEEAAGELPELYVPQLAADREGRIHAFWLDEDAILQHSSVPGDSFAESSSWAGTTTVAEGVLTSAVTVDATGSFHLAYIQSQDEEESPAGIYYRRSDDGAVNWTEATALSHSAYFRSLPVEQANISIATTTVSGAGRVFVAWDLRAREKVFVMQSNDNGTTWPEAREVDARNARDEDLAQGPSKIQVVTAGSQIHLVWQAGHDGALCSQYHQWSPDGGNSWEAPQIILPDLLVCPNAVDLLVGQDGRLLLAVTVEGSVQPGGYLVAWNGAQWSELRQQEPLTSFTNPETLRPVSLGCREHLLRGDQLMVMGCSTGEIQDIWLLARPLGTLDDWFPAPSGWEVAPVLATAANEIRFTTVIPDRDGWLHVFWVEAESSTINYVFWDGLRWSSSFPILTSPSGAVDRPTALLTAERRLLVMWNAVESGKYYYSLTGADDAAFTEEWIAPRELPVLRDGVTSADVIVDGTDNIYVAFAVPINEGRGIYLMRSNDRGETWSEPAIVFDAVANEWAMVDEPQLAVTADGTLHLLWTRYAPPPVAQPQSLAYARSEDGGESWSQPQIVTETRPMWSRITSTGESSVHRHWQEPGDDRVIVRQQTSVDNGLRWSVASQAGDAGASGPLDLIADSSGKLHLVYSEGPHLDYWLWDGQSWTRVESLALARTDLSTVSALAASVTSDSSLAVVFAGRTQERDESAAESQSGNSEESSAAIVEEHNFMLQFARQPVALSVLVQQPPEVNAVLEAPTVAPEAEEAAAAGAPSPSPAAPTEAAPLATGVSAPRESGANSRLANLDLQTIIVLALLPAGLLVLLMLAFHIYRVRKAE
jgi:hypothetical protein